MRTAAILGRLMRATVELATSTSRRGPRADGATPRASHRRAPRPAATGADVRPAYPGDFTGRFRPVYSPDLDGAPDPGEIVWTWVPFEEDHARGKDRPVLVVGHDGPWLLGLMLSTRDHDDQPGRDDERWVDLGTGDWDARRRPSEVRTDRVLRLDPSAVRREGAVLDRRRFDLVARSLGGSRD